MVTHPAMRPRAAAMCPNWDTTRTASTGPSAADRHHVLARAATPLRGELVAVRLHGDARADQIDQGLDGGALPQRPAEVDLLVARQAGVQLPRRGEPHPVAGVAELLG